MAHHDQQHTDKTPAEIIDRVWELAEKIDFCMFVTWDGERQQARPLSSRVHRDENAIYFLVSAEGHKNSQIDRFPVVNLAYADTGAMDYVSISGTASLSNDRTRIAELWSAFDKAWWDDENDPDIRLITVNPERAELWDSPGKLVAFTAMLTASVTGAKPDFGDNATVRL
ncbi:pyridoxamine 5'-phosphate oxidase family protein [Roseovarius sp.]|uniref:pyridoxamine 5'-phosphate oxidase family protein n=1 Tax=Roseovarius sp. TaxID=1486281 RepID=UPI003A96DF4F